MTSALLGRGSVILVDNLSVGRPMPPTSPGLTCYQEDIRDRDAMAAIVLRHRPGAVIHLAALHHIPSCERDPAKAMDVNVMGFQSILDACALAGCRRVVLASSGAVYDWADRPLSETDAIAPRDVYSASKAANEHQLTAWTMAGRGSGVIARMFNVIGPDDPNGHLIPDILGRLQGAEGSQLDLRLGNLDTRRDFVDVRDMAAGLAALADWRGGDAPTPEIFNLCSGRECTVSEIATKLAEHMGVRASLVSDPALRRAIDRPSQLGLPDKMARQFGWRAGRDLDDSIDTIVRSWQRNHPA